MLLTCVTCDCEEEEKDEKKLIKKLVTATKKHLSLYLKLLSDNSKSLLLINFNDSKRNPWKVSSSTYCSIVWLNSTCFTVPWRNSMRETRENHNNMLYINF